MDNTVKSAKKLTTSNTLANAVKFLVEQTLREMVSTAEVVSINAADRIVPPGRVVTPRPRL